MALARLKIGGLLQPVRVGEHRIDGGGEDLGRAARHVGGRQQLRRRREEPVVGGAAVGQALLLAREGRVVSADGEVIPMAADSICVHGDTPDAVELAGSVRSALESGGLAVEAFA